MSVIRRSSDGTCGRDSQKQGRITWVLGQVSAERAPDGNPRSFIDSITDVTVAHGAAQELQRTLELMQTILDQTQAAVFFKDLDWRYEFNNNTTTMVAGQ